MGFTLVYDSTCGPCVTFRRIVGFFARQRLSYLGLDEAENEGKLFMVSLALRRRSFHLVADDGRAWSGADGVLPLVGVVSGSPLFSEALARCPPVRSLVGLAYSSLARRHDSGSCPSYVEREQR